MSLIVHKYGGTSMGSPERIQSVAKRVAKWVRAGHRMIVVPSAMSGETNRLLALAKQLAPERPTPESLRELDAIAATGEQVSVGLLALALHAEGIAAVSYAGWQVPIATDVSYTKARIQSIDDARIRADLDAGKVVVITGFQGVDPHGHVTTLGRGGSDTSAVAVAAALKADECLIYTDVDGVYTTDPRIVADARRLTSISFEEMLEMASLGSKVLQIRSVEFAGKYRVPLRVLSSFTPWDIAIDEEARSGTLITFEEDVNMEQAVVSGIAFNRDEAKISLMGVARSSPGIAHMILGPCRRREHRRRRDHPETSRTTVAPTSRSPCRATTTSAHDGADEERGDPEDRRRRAAMGDDRICKVSIVGIGMRSHVGVASRMFSVLSEEGINIQMITTSEIKTSVVLDEKYMELAVRALHKAFGLEQEPART